MSETADTAALPAHEVDVPVAAEPHSNRAKAERILKWVLIISVVDLVMFIGLMYGVITGDRALTPVLGPLHGVGVIAEVALVGYGALEKWWGWWYLIVTVVTTGPPGAILGHNRAKREALGTTA